MIGLALACTLSLIAVCGLGFATLRLLQVSAASRLTLADVGIAGFTTLGLVGMVVNFIAPLSAWVTGLTMLAALACARRHRTSLYQILGDRPRMALLTLGVLIVAVTLGALRAPLHPDTGIYHFQTILWQHEAPVAAGLSNLDGKLGFNSIWHTVAAMFWLPGFELTGVFGVNALMVILVVFGLMQHTAAAGGGAGLSRWLAAFCLIALCISAFRGTGSPNTDYPAALLNIYVFCLAARLSEAWVFDRGNAPELQSCLTVLVVAVALALTLKLTQAMLALLPLFYLLALARSGGARVEVAPGIVFAIALGAMWMLRNIVLSGCAVYPHPATCLQTLGWAINPQQVADLYQLLRTWGRSVVAPLAAVQDNWDWVPDWFAYIYRYKLVWVPQALCLAGVAVLVARRIARPDIVAHSAVARMPGSQLALLFGTAAAGLVFWFFSGPDIRFAYGNLISAPFLLLAWCLARAGIAAPSAGRWTLGLILAGLMLVHAAYLQREAGVSGVMAQWPRLPEVRDTEKDVYPGTQIYRANAEHDCWRLRPCAQRLPPGLETKQHGPWTTFQIRRPDGR
jgi:hypothetical protein